MGYEHIDGSRSLEPTTQLLSSASPSGWQKPEMTISISKQDLFGLSLYYFVHCIIRYLAWFGRSKCPYRRSVACGAMKPSRVALALVEDDCLIERASNFLSIPDERIQGDRWRTVFMRLAHALKISYITYNATPTTLRRPNSRDLRAKVTSTSIRNVDSSQAYLSSAGNALHRHSEYV
ncbi:hypothetical protein CEXT_504341 [Caerostris extrusa]|uniref:Uncharacterized protein n=1 Tax=Caerostris extrusa TaxID=172846 RepID=A0AAV4TGW5_CAEEX|nr:hypothetical protein CEXT_504341 [Caerostris extrusa]